MLCMNSYPKAYIADCRKTVTSQVTAWRTLAKAVGDKDGAVTKALTAVETAYFGNLVLALEGYFVHRARGAEKKDGNPLNEVRMLAASLMTNGGQFELDKAIKYDPTKAVLGLKPGDPIRVDEAAFTRLSEAYFSEIEKKFRA